MIKKMIFVVMCTQTIISCSGEEGVIEPVKLVYSNGIQLVELINGDQIVPINSTTRTNPNSTYALRFDSESTYQSTLGEIKDQSREYKLAFAKK